MRKQSKFLVVILPTLILTSCGYGLKEVYDGAAYNSPVFEENYYRVWNSKIDENSNKNAITSSNSRSLTETDYLFKTYDSPVAKRVDKDIETLSYYDDYPSHDESKIGVGYGPTKRLSLLDNSFRYGYVSKLFDGQLFCNGKYQIARTQIDEGGFGILFEKETPKLDYIAINFKAAVDYTTETRVSGHVSTVDFKVSFYCKNDKGYDKKTFVCENLDVNCNAPENPNNYTFFGFKLDDREVLRVQGISIEYKLKSDEYVTAYNLDHSLLIYEILLPNTTWR